MYLSLVSRNVNMIMFLLLLYSYVKYYFFLPFHQERYLNHPQRLIQYFLQKTIMIRNLQESTVREQTFCRNKYVMCHNTKNSRLRSKDQHEIWVFPYPMTHILFLYELLKDNKDVTTRNSS